MAERFVARFPSKKNKPKEKSSEESQLESDEDYAKRTYRNKGFVINGRVIPIVKLAYQKDKKKI